MVATQINIFQHNLKIKRKHLLEQLKAEMDSGMTSAERVL
jgi:hypothetical protein